MNSDAPHSHSGHADPLLEAPAGFRLRRMIPEDIPQILELIKDLATYEREPDAVRATEESLHAHFFGENPAVFGHVVEVVGDNAEEGSAESDVADVAEGAVQGAAASASPETARHQQPHLAGMALWFLNFSTWESTHGIYLEDLYVRPEYRKRGLGKLLLQQLASLCVARGYQRLEWCVLKWNEPSIQFYKSVGAYPMSGWDTFRLDGAELHSFGA